MSSSGSLKEVAQQAAYSIWGYVPDRDIKPVHFANAFFRSLSNKSGSPSLLQEAAGNFKAGKSALSTEQFLQEARKCIAQPDRHKTKERSKELRAALDAVLSQDNGLYAKGPFSLTLTHWRQTSSDPSDRGTGHLMAKLVADHGKDGTLQKLRGVLDDKGDAVYKLTAPLLEKEDGSMETRKDIPPTEDSKTFFDSLDDTPSALKEITAGIDRLSEHADRLEKTAFLQRLVSFCGFALYYHVVNSTSEGRRGENTPILLCSTSTPTQVRNASRATFRMGKLRIRKAFEEEMRRLSERRGDDEDMDRQDYIERVEDLLERGNSKQEERDRLLAQFIDEFDAAKQAAGSSLEGFVRAIVPICFEQIGTKDPASSLTFMSRHIGFVGPMRGPGEKYFRSSPQFLDALVCALVKPEEGVITESEFWRRAYVSFGIFCGARRRDSLEILDASGIRKASSNSLQENALSIRSELERQGYAETYADSSTLIEAS